jgi:hypothetical protein
MFKPGGLIFLFCTVLISILLVCGCVTEDAIDSSIPGSGNRIENPEDVVKVYWQLLDDGKYREAIELELESANTNDSEYFQRWVDYYKFKYGESGEDLEIISIDIVKSDYIEKSDSYQVQYIRKYNYSGYMNEISDEQYVKQYEGNWKIWTKWPLIDVLHTVPKIVWRIGGENVDDDDVIVRYINKDPSKYEWAVTVNNGEYEVLSKQIMNSPVPGDEIIFKDLASIPDARIIAIGAEGGIYGGKVVS